MSWNYQTKQLIPQGGPSPERWIVDASTTVYSKEMGITHLDSVHGVFVLFVGERGGGDVTVQVQQSLCGGSGADWKDVGATFLMGAGGVYNGAQAVLNQLTLLYPAANTTFAPFLRLKITTAAVTQFSLSKLAWTVRGLN